MKDYKAGYYGFLVGSALGVPLEFIEREKLIESPVTDMLSGGYYDQIKGAWSSNGSLLIATMDSISTKLKIDYDDLIQKYAQWLTDGKYTSTEVFGDTTIYLKIIEKYQNDNNPLECGLDGINYIDNGPLMRMLPIAYYCYDKALAENDIIDLVCDVTSLTHKHEICLIGCYIYVRYIMFLLDGVDKYDAYLRLKDLDYTSFSSLYLKEYRRILKDDLINYPLKQISSSNNIVDTLETAIWCINNTSTFKESLIGVINLGDDTDAIGAITGSMAGIIYGFEQIPNDWMDNLQKKDYLNLIYNLFAKAMANM